MDCFTSSVQQMTVGKKGGITIARIRSRKYGQTASLRFFYYAFVE